MARLYWRDTSGRWRNGRGRFSSGPKRAPDLRQYPRRRHAPPDIYVPPPPKRRPKPKAPPPVAPPVELTPNELPESYTSTFRHFLMPVRFLQPGIVRKIFALVDVLALKMARRSPSIREGLKGTRVREETVITLPLHMMDGTAADARKITREEVDAMCRLAFGQLPVAFYGLFVLRRPEDRSDLMGQLRRGELS